MIIIEGCDNTGKSTLLKQLCSRIPELRYVEHGPRPPKDYNDYFTEMLGVMSEGDVDRVIVDRFYFSELVYGPILRGKVGLAPCQVDFLNATLRDIKPFIIICYNTNAAIKSTFSEREQLEGVEENIDKIQEKFFSLFKGKNSYHDIEHTFYDWREGLINPAYGLEALIVEIKAYLRRKQDER